jgi:nitrate reductase molybdenum cofactor assembly chaperone NarJ/NarW
MVTFKVLSLLLGYPNAAVHEALGELQAVLDRDALLPPPQDQAVRELIGWMRARQLMTLQEEYGELFDRGRKLSLHIFEHTHGESRDRGPAMIQLMEQYQEAGFELAARELPDYLPLVLEFAAARPLEEAQELLAEAMPVLTLLGARLHARGSRFAAIFDALEAVAGAPEEAELLRRQAAEEGPDESITRMDEIWEEEAVTFTQEAPDKQCGTSSRGGAAQPVQWDVGVRSG